MNQAVEHEDVPGVMVEGQGDVCRGFALRGANCKYLLVYYLYDVCVCVHSFCYQWAALGSCFVCHFYFVLS